MLPPLFSSLDSPRIFYVTTTIKWNDGERCFDFEISLDDKKKRWKKGVVRWAMERKISEGVYIFRGTLNISKGRWFSKGGTWDVDMGKGFSRFRVRNKFWGIGG